MRLGDLEEAKKKLFSYYSFVNEDTNKSNYTGETLMSYEVADMIEDCIENTPSINTETLPIVQELKEQLAKVTAERDAAIDSLENICMYGDPPCKYCHEQGKCLFNDSPEYCINFYWEGFPKLFDKFNEV